MEKLKDNLLTIDEVATLLGKSIEVTNEILEKSNIPIAGRSGHFVLYDSEVITQFLIDHPELIAKYA
jgi:hypothetical protein